MSKKWDGQVWNGLVRLSLGKVAGVCEFSGQPLGTIKCEEFLEYLRNS
jgi:hypothetical protein